MKYKIKLAEFDESYFHRIKLVRICHEEPMALIIGFNPSTADEFKDDSTTRRLSNFCKENGYGGFTIINLFTRIDKSPYNMIQGIRRNEPGIYDKYKSIIESHQNIILIWGDILANHQDVTYHKRRMAYLMEQSKKPIYCFGISKKGNPKHPLYLPKTTKLIAWKN